MIGNADFSLGFGLAIGSIGDFTFFSRRFLVPVPSEKVTDRRIDMCWNQDYVSNQQTERL
jgi:hypothetical protein